MIRRMRKTTTENKKRGENNDNACWAHPVRSAVFGYSLTVALHNTALYEASFIIWKAGKRREDESSPLPVLAWRQIIELEQYNIIHPLCPFIASPLLHPTRTHTIHPAKHMANLRSSFLYVYIQKETSSLCMRKRKNVHIQTVGTPPAELAAIDLACGSTKRCCRGVFSLFISCTPAGLR